MYLNKDSSVIRSCIGSLTHRLTEPQPLMHWFTASSTQLLHRLTAVIHSEAASWIQWFIIIHWFNESVIRSLNEIWLIHWFTESLIQLSIDQWFTESSIHWFIGSLIHRFIDCNDSLVCCIIDSWTHFFIGSLIHRLSNYSQWVTESPTHWCTDSLIHWFMDSSSSRWLTASLFHSFIENRPTYAFATFVQVNSVQFIPFLFISFISSLICRIIGSLVDVLIHWIIIDSLIHWVICAWVLSCHFIRISTNAFADSLMHLATSTCFCIATTSHRPLISYSHFIFFETSAPASAGHYLECK